MTKATGPIADMHVVVDLYGDRHASAFAMDVARRLDAHLTGIAVAIEPLIPLYPMAAPVPTDFIVAAREAAANDARTAVEAFEEMTRASGVASAKRALAMIAGEGFGELVETCRLSDLVVVGQSDPDNPEPLRAPLIEALWFDAAAPTLLIPYAGVSEFNDRRALVAWDGSAQAGRALRAALPLLRQTREVIVAMVSEEEKWTAAVPGADVADHLARHGLTVEVKRLDNAVGDVATTLLNALSDEEADWMVMGAYGHSRVRQMLLGGVTRTVLGAATVPVLMAH